MRAKIMLLRLLQLLPLLLVSTDPIADLDLQKEMGSRSMDLENAPVGERHFRLTRSIYKTVSASPVTPCDAPWKEKPKVEREKADKPNGNLSNDRVTRIKRSEDLWIRSEIDETDDFLEMHAFVVRDEDIPECDTPADKVTKSRYFMCSGVILDENHVLTSATCVNQAYIDEYRIEADLAVLIGALDKNSYIIKIAHYEIHPSYVPDPNSIHHATNNIALLRLSCSIPRNYVIVPKLPSKRFEDIAHLCCSNSCKLSTVITNSENHHFIRLMELRHLPSPMHIDIRNSNAITKKRLMMNSNGKFQQEAIDEELSPEILRSRSVRQLISDDVKTTDLTNSSESSESANYELEDEDGAIGWEKVKMEIYAANVSEKNQKLLSNFVQNSMSDIMTKLLEVVTHHIADMNNVFSYFQNIPQERTFHGKGSNQRISDFIGRSVLKFALKRMSLLSDSNVKNCTKKCSECSDKSERSDKGESEIKINKIVEKSEKLLDKDDDVISSDNVFCPPLGSPVMANNTLVALIAYTCDDRQNWVDWKYVNIIQNIRWIRKELKRNFLKNDEKFRSS